MISLRRQLLMAHRRARAWSGSAHAYQCSLLLRKGGVFFVAPGSRSRTTPCSTMARAEHGRMAVWPSSARTATPFLAVQLGSRWAHIEHGRLPGLLAPTSSAGLDENGLHAQTPCPTPPHGPLGAQPRFQRTRLLGCKRGAGTGRHSASARRCGVLDATPHAAAPALA